MYCGIIEHNLSYSRAFIKNNYITVIFNESKIPFSKSLNNLKYIINEADMKFSISNSFVGLHRLDIYYNQSLYAIKSESLNQTSNNIIYIKI